MSPREPGKNLGEALLGTRRNVSIDEIARQAGVSKATVSRVINGVPGRVSSETRKRVQDTIQAFYYRPSRAGSALRQGRSHLVGLLVPDPGNAYHASIAVSIEESLRNNGNVMVLANTGEDPVKQDDMIREMRALSAAGIVMLGAVKSPELEKGLADGDPFIFVNRRAPYPMPAPFIGIDNRAAAAAVAEHFVAHGHRKISMFHRGFELSGPSDRAISFRQRFLELVGGDGTLLEFEVSGRRKESAYDIASRTFTADDMPRAIFCTTDEIAYGVARHCMDLGLSLNRDVMIFGFDGNPLNDYLAPWLNTITAVHEEFGPAVVQTLRGLLGQDGPPRKMDTILPFEKIVANENHEFHVTS